MSITLTEAAATQIRTQLAKRGKGLGLRIGVKNVGCSGFAYTYEIADELKDGEHVFESHGVERRRRREEPGLHRRRAGRLRRAKG